MKQDPVATEEMLQELLEYVMDSEGTHYDEYLAEHFPEYADVLVDDVEVMPDLLDPRVKHIYKTAVLLSQEFFGEDL